MVLDKHTDKVYFSELLSTDRRYSTAYHRICAILEKHQVPHGFLQGTKGIWCRDYMPLQKSTSQFIQFRYEPSYLQEDLHLQTDPNECLAANHLSAMFSNINLDGGNVLRWIDRVILSERIFSENDDVARSKLIGARTPFRSRGDPYPGDQVRHDRPRRRAGAVCGQRHVNR
jgi:agmatine deiminase